MIKHYYDNITSTITTAEVIMRGVSEVGDVGDGRANGGAGERADDVGDEGDGGGRERGASRQSDERGATQETRAEERAQR